MDYADILAMIASAIPDVVAAEEEAVREFGTGPGAVRFISGTFQSHVQKDL